MTDQTGKPTIYNLTISVLIFLICSGCTNFDLRCFEKEQEKIRDEEVYNKIRNAFQDTLKNWVNRELQPKRNLADKIYKLDDALICDNNRTKCIFFILQRDTISKIRYSTKFIGCEINADNSWDFYYRPYPTTYYSYLTENDDPFNYMSKETHVSLISDGLIKNCKINDGYLTGETWFSDDRKKEHESFLKDIP